MVADNTTWRSWPLHRLGIGEELIHSAEEDGIFTAGQLFDSPDYAEDEEVRQAMQRLYDAHPEYARADEAAAEVEAEEESMSESEIWKKHYKQIRKAADRCAVLGADLAEAKRVAADLKKEYDGATTEFLRLTRRGPDPQRELPFSEEEGEESEVDASFEVVESWDKADVGLALGLTAKQQEKLAEAGITTMGQFEKLRAGDGLTSIKGVGRALADQLEDRCLEWLDTNRDHFGASIDPVASQAP